ncbi:carbonic anhydrase family protein [Shewanella avicenniae]|uniref:Carbonic anhydrase n=1 Tax=Shewanella avicenniae TaxID=2814294 RepID=A0ABX7QRQ5_9GAMM|nr:carbonic anhydrase family protein [Shewanella avicenniae]QSX33600.1 carbonic anhydrase family protein [Shewanella avicenniae]
MKNFLLASAIMLAFSGAAQASDWGYSGHHGPEHWGDIAGTCAAGVNQSPIDVTKAVKAELSALELNYAGQVTELTNNGHTLQASVTGTNTLTVDGDVFELKQFHFHTPSENLIEGKQYPLEAHFVNQDKQGNLAVVAVMFDAGADNPALAALAAAIPSGKGTKALPKSFDVKEMLPSTEHYYRFNGSLTTPPCTEGVRWFVMQDAKALSAEQQKVLTDTMGHNNRPVQAPHARVVLVK